MTPALWKAMVSAAQAKFPLRDAEVTMVDLTAYTNELQAWRERIAELLMNGWNIQDNGHWVRTYKSGDAEVTNEAFSLPIAYYWHKHPSQFQPHRMMGKVQPCL